MTEREFRQSEIDRFTALIADLGPKEGQSSVERASELGVSVVGLRKILYDLKARKRELIKKNMQMINN